jgi:hypothetical protein
MIDGAMGTEIQTYKLQDADYRGTNKCHSNSGNDASSRHSLGKESALFDPVLPRAALSHQDPLGSRALPQLV